VPNSKAHSSTTASNTCYTTDSTDTPPHRFFFSSLLTGDTWIYLPPGEHPYSDVRMLNYLLLSFLTSYSGVV
jgi:hypothetical protein